MATARSRNWSDTACIVEAENVLHCPSPRVGCRAACRGNRSGRLSPADNMLPDHAHVRFGERKRNDHEVQRIISQSLVLQQHSLRTLSYGDIGPLSDRKWP